MSFKIIDFVYFSIGLMFIRFWIEESATPTAMSPNVVHGAPDVKYSLTVCDKVTVL